MNVHIGKRELTRAFSGWGMRLALLIGAGIAVYHFASFALPSVTEQRESIALGHQPTAPPYELWDAWLGRDAGSLAAYLYRLLLPVLAALPFAASYATDAHSGYLRQTVTRAGAAKVHASKAFAVWLSGGTAAVWPLVCDFLLCMTVMPLRGPTRQVNFLPGSSLLFGEWYAHAPFVYLLLYALLIFAFCGAMALFGLFVSLWLRNRFFVLAVPFVTYLFAAQLSATLDPIGCASYVPMQFLYPGQIAQPRPECILCEWLLLMMCGVGYVLLARRRDVM